MKTVYIPKGKTVHYESLVTDHLVVKGCLDVTYGIKAKTISGSGVTRAGSVEADSIRMDSLEAATIICKRLIAKRVQAPEVFASESAAVSCFLSAAYVETGRLTAAVSEIDVVKADEVVNLAKKKRTLFGTLLASALRSFWTALTVPRPDGEIMDAEYAPVTEAPDAQPQSAAEAEQKAEPVDEELNRFVNMFKLAREGGFTLKIVPGTPEENAPIFDFETETIQRPAA
mgnify:CR=1 FL=1